MNFPGATDLQLKTSPSLPHLPPPWIATPLDREPDLCSVLKNDYNELSNTVLIRFCGCFRIPLSAPIPGFWSTEVDFQIVVHLILVLVCL